MNVDLNMASNMRGPIGGEVRARLVAAIERPGEETWEDAYTIILNRDRWVTLWQAVIAIDPSFAQVSGPVTRWVEDGSELGGHSEPVSGWERTPDAETIVQAIGYATR